MFPTVTRFALDPPQDRGGQRDAAPGNCIRAISSPGRVGRTHFVKNGRPNKKCKRPAPMPISRGWGGVGRPEKRFARAGGG